MKNTYEFNIGDINNAVVDGGTLIIYYDRISDNEFVETFSAPVDMSNGKCCIICPRCGRWNFVNPEDKDNVICEFCDEDYKEIHSESDMINILLSYMDDNTFDGIDLIINNIHIV